MTLPTDETAMAPVQQRQAAYFGGSSSRRRRVALRFGAGLEIVEDGAVVATWPYADIRRIDGPPTLLRLGCVSALPLARLDIEDAATIEAVVAHSPSLDVGRGKGQTGRIVFWSLAAACSIVAMVVYGIPSAADRLAPLMPRAVENRVGQAVDAQVRLIFGKEICSEPEGRAAFAKLVDKLRTAAGMDNSVAAEVLPHSLPNAFALPGGKIYLLIGLLQAAQNPDEIAGVLAHELGHVQHRDSMRLLIQTGGTSFLIGLLFGDVIGGSAVIFATRSLLNASYSRGAEQQADAFATEVMHKLGRSPRPMGEFLLRITGSMRSSEVLTSSQEDNVAKSKKESIAKSPRSRGFTIFDSHPLTEDRLAAMTKVDRPITGPELLSAAEWTALKAVCRTPKK